MKLTIEVEDKLDGDGLPSGEVQVNIVCDPPIKSSTPCIGAVSVLDNLLAFLKENKEKPARGQEGTNDENSIN